MKKQMKVFSLLGWMLLCCFGLYAQNIKMTRIPSVPQLPVSALHRIFQDSEGYMWYGTVNGLCRDDGYQIKVFRSDFETPDLLNDNTVQCIAEADNGQIWFGTDHGAYILDKKGYSIVPLDTTHLSSSFIISIWNSDGFMWVSKTGMLLKYNMEGTFVKSYPITNDDGFPSHVNGFCKTRQKDIWVTISNNGVARYDKTNDAFVVFKRSYLSYTVSSIIQDVKNDFFWLGTWAHGVVKFDPWASEEEIYKSSPLPVNSQGQQETTVLYLAQDEENGDLWFTTMSDLMSMRYNKQTGILEQIHFPNMLSPFNKMLNDIIRDKNGNIWVAAFDMPSFIISFVNKQPIEYSLDALRNRVGFNPAIMAVCDAGENYVWLSQERTGLCLYNLKSNDVSLFVDYPDVAQAPLWAVKQMAPSQRKGNVWVIQENSSMLFELSHSDQSMRLDRKISLPSDSYSYFTKVYEDNNNLLWIGTDKGLIGYSLSEDTIRYNFPQLGYVSAILSDKKGGIWVSTLKDGVYKIKEDKVSKCWNEVKSVSCMDLSGDGRLWIGTTEGRVLLYDSVADTYEDYTIVCGLNGDAVNQIVADVYGHLWVSTNQRLIEYNPQNNAQDSYLTRDKLFLLDRFIPTTMCRMLDGKLAFGGIPGLCLFTPSDKLDKVGENVKTVITDVLVKEHSLLFQEPGTRLEKGITLTKNSNNIKFNFSSLDILNARKIRYAYRMAGLEKEWSYTGIGENTVSYKHLPKGDYIFEVKATDKYGVWSQNVTSVRVTCLPAFYETWWAKMFYVLFGLSLILLWARYDIKRRNSKNEELYADSVELAKMRDYLRMPGNDKAKAEIEISDMEVVQLDELLLQKILKAVEDNISEPDFDVSILAEKVGMSRSSLTRKLKSITGLTPLEYIKKVKMKHAKILLEDRNKNVSDVSLFLGYFNRKHFTKCFKDEFGMTPSEYQKSIFDRVESVQNSGENE